MEHIYWKKFGYLLYNMKQTFEREAKQPKQVDAPGKIIEVFDKLFKEVDTQLHEIEDLNRTDLRSNSKSCPKEIEKLHAECSDLKSKYVKSSEDIGKKLELMQDTLSLIN